MAHDRVERDEFPLTQEVCRHDAGRHFRPTVTIVAGMLQQADLIAYQRGRITVVDRQGLEQASCECYAIATALLAGVRAVGSK
jgi:hypothetical protein